MPICSYLVVPDPGAMAAVERRIAAIPECRVVAATNRDVLLLVTDTPTLEREAELRAEVESIEGIQALLLAFGEIDPDAAIADPVASVAGRVTSAGDPVPGPTNPIASLADPTGRR